MEKIYYDVKKLIGEIFIAVAENKISVDLPLVKSAANLLKVITEGSSDSYKNEIPFSFKHRGKRYSMFEHVIQVTKLMLNDKKDFNSACNEIAERKSVTTASIWQACCRSLNLNAKDWKSMYSGNSDSKIKICQSLLRKYPEQTEVIDNLFEFKGE